MLISKSKIIRDIQTPFDVLNAFDREIHKNNCIEKIITSLWLFIYWWNIQGGPQKSIRFSQVITSLLIELGIWNRYHWKVYTLKFVYDILLFFQSITCHCNTNREPIFKVLDYTLENIGRDGRYDFQPPSDLDYGYSIANEQTDRQNHANIQYRIII